MSIQSVIRPRVHPSQHFLSRLRNRLKLKTKKAKKNFIKGALRDSLALRDIPQEKFSFFLAYMARRERRIRHWKPYLRLFLYRDWFILVDECDGRMVTIYKINRRWRHIYYDIRMAILYAF